MQLVNSHTQIAWAFWPCASKPVMAYYASKLYAFKHQSDNTEEQLANNIMLSLHAM